MAQVRQSAACLRIHGKDLDPDGITRVLGATPSKTIRKGQEIPAKAPSSLGIAKAGMWKLQASDRTPEDLDGQIEEILAQTTNDMAIWRGIGENYRIDLFCGLFMGLTNEGMSLSAGSLAALGERGIRLEIDIYSGCDGAEPDI
jgi:hypothetical protein